MVSRFTMLLRAAAFGCLTLVISACESESVRTDWAFEEHRAGDTLSILTVSGQVWPLEVRPTVELSIGVLDGDESLMFGNVTRLAEDQSGGIYVMDDLGPIIRHFDAAGGFVGFVGRGGQGPGEYRRLTGMVVDAAGVLYLSDWGNGRIARFSADDQPLDPWRVDALFATTVAGRWVFSDGPGRVLLRATAGDRPALLVFEDGQAVDTLEVPALPGMPSERGGPYRIDEYWGFHPDGYFVVGVSAEYSFDVRRRGEVVRIGRTIEPMPVHAEEASEVRRRFEWMEAEPMYNPPAGEWIPSYMPPYRGLEVGDDGRIWVRRNTTPVRVRAEASSTGPPPITWRQPHAYDVFEVSGRFLGSVRFPDDLEPLLFGDGHIWGIRRGEFDEQYVVRIVLEGID